MKRIAVLGIAALPLFGMGVLALGQQAGGLQQEREQRKQTEQIQQDRQGQFQQGRQAQQRGQRGQQAVSDQDLAQWLIIENRGEVELAQWAQEQAKNDQVKQFAQQMVQEHRQMIQQLQQAAGGQTGAAFRGERDGQQQQQQQQQKKQQRQEVQEERRELQQERQELQKQQRQSGQQQGGQSGWLSIKEELGQQMVQSTKKSLQNVRDQKFDEAFLSQQIFMHMKELDTLKVFQQHAGPELKQVLQQAERTTQEHLQHADQLLQQIKQQGGQGGQQQQGERRTFRQQQN